MNNDTEFDVPGTTRIFDERGEVVGSNNFTLVPTPSTDPEDPLNWSQPRKWLQLTCVVLFILGLCFCSGCLSAIYAPFSEATGMNLNDINSGIGYAYLCMGIFQLFTQPLALAIGKRPVMIVSIIGAAGYTFWVTHVKSVGEWYAANIYFGFVASPLFVLPELCLTDTFFYHERGAPLGIYVAATYGGAILAPILAGYIYTGLGWHAPPYFAGGFCLVVAVFLIIFHEETTFDRKAAQVVTTTDVRNQVGDDKNVATTTVQQAPNTDVKGDIYDVHDSKEVYPPEDERAVHSYDRIVSPWRGPRPWRMFKISPFAKGLMWRGMVFPIAMLRLPVILWCGMIFALYQVFYNQMVALASGVLSVQPYNLQPNSVGLTFLSPFIAIVPGAVVGGMLVDWFTVRQAKKNHGVSEAEHKVKLMLIPTILAPFGLLMIGLGPYYSAHWMVFVAGEFVLTISGPLATLLSITYAFDAFHEIRPENENGPQAEVQDCAPYVQSIILMAMVITFAFNYAITPWAFDWGFRNYGISAACIATAVNLSHLLILKYGKSMRRRGAPFYRKVINW